MSYQVTARKWRPTIFEEVVGQTHVTSTLRNAIASNRLAHAYIFSGARGCGKTTTARILAKAINCLSPKEFNPDNTCEICQEITAGRNLDVIEIDGASNRGVEEIRNLRESVRYTPTRGTYKVYIIDEVHMLTKEAFNALLKTLEEPPAHVIFIFATTEVHKIPMTILSRCQRFDFRRISIEEIIARLRFIAKEEQVTIDDNALVIIAKKGDGSLRDAQSIFDQIRSFCGNTIAAADVLKVLNVVDQELFFRVTEMIRSGNVRGGIELVDELVRHGYDLREFLSGLSEHLRNILVVMTTESTQLVEASEVYRKRYSDESKQFQQSDVLRLIKLVNDLEQAIRWAPQPRFKLEVGILQMIKLDRAVQLDRLIKQIEEMKKKLDGAPVGSAIHQPTMAPPLPEKTKKPDVPPPILSGSSEQQNDNGTREIKVLGKVSAGTLSSTAAIRLSAKSETPSPVIEKEMVKLSLLAGGAGEIQSSRENGRPISPEQANEQWSEWIGEVRRSKIGVGTILSESHLLEVRDGALHIGCPDDFHYSSLKRNKDFLVDAFERVTGFKVRIEPVMHKIEKSGKRQTSNLRENATPAPGGRGEDTRTTGVSSEDHPVITALKREFGADLIR
ncbi:MAG: DNA polymerase III subunit gamma/tau [bacterium]